MTKASSESKVESARGHTIMLGVVRTVVGVVSYGIRDTVGGI
jgi:hypothetical protein